MSIWKRPEELVMAILGVLWLVLTYFVAAYAVQGSVKYVLMITGLTALWTILSFVLWQRNRWVAFWPVLVGLLVACWWSWLDWLALPHLSVTRDAAGVTTLHTAWYATWAFKLILAIVPVVGLYVMRWRKQRQRRINGII